MAVLKISQFGKLKFNLELLLEEESGCILFSFGDY